MSRRLAVFAAVAVTALAGCGDDEEDATPAATATDTAATEAAEALQDEIANLSDEEQIERVGEAWADPFAKQDEAMCAYLHPDLGGATACSSNVSGELAGSIRVQESFAGARVESVDIEGQTASAEFSNGQEVRFGQDPDGAWRVTDLASR